MARDQGGQGLRLDQRDHALLAALSRDAWLTYAELGALISLSASATQRRVEKFVAAGVIEGAHARIAPKALGRPLQLFALIELRDESEAAIASLARTLSENPAVRTIHYLAGAVDLLVALQCESMEEYAELAERAFNGNPAIRRYQTLTALRTLK